MIVLKLLTFSMVILYKEIFLESNQGIVQNMIILVFSITELIYFVL